MKKGMAVLLIGAITIGITACGGGGTTASSVVESVESAPAVESLVTQEVESMTESIESKTQNIESEKTVAGEAETQFVGIDEDGMFSITDVISDADEIIVPDNINGVTVGKIKKEAFAELNCKKIVIPDSVISIGKCAFINCVNLESIELGSGVTSVGSMAFQSCLKLKKVSFAEGLTTIKGTLFYDCGALEEAYIPASATDIEAGLANSETCPNLVIVTPAGSRAEEVAKSQGVPVRNS